MTVLGRQTFANMKSLVQISYIRDVDSMLQYCEEFVSSPALQTLKEAVKGCNIKQLHDMAKMIRKASKKIERALTGDELAVALNNWQETGSITKAVQAVYEWFLNISTHKSQECFSAFIAANFGPLWNYD